ncbi:transposase InsO family protein [Gracilibacillus halotolerans]|uniref:Transposase InsO family protein n=1 Tax=Gracilibacillus halotolerans TaxID=74386 RepID=A0A841RM51_9BACI|nr:IS3 family transposase [Gracilibacillus halotolerans]MBB6512004.1 transposase InsO family protein [Gracilibacillus halotolerans]
MYWQKRLNEADSDEEIQKEISEISKEHKGNYGYRRITLELRKRGFIVNHKKVLTSYESVRNYMYEVYT